MLFCDEPTGNLDSESGVQVCRLLWGLCRKNRSAMIIVTHEEKIARQADRIIRIEDGRLK
jgi:ABC-type lipoprotein export system ATPase subunit